MQTTNSKPFAPVALVQAQQYDPALIDRAVERLLELLNIPSEWFENVSPADTLQTTTENTDDHSLCRGTAE